MGMSLDADEGWLVTPLQKGEGREGDAAGGAGGPGRQQAAAAAAVKQTQQFCLATSMDK